jgi:hypothetical protein
MSLEDKKTMLPAFEGTTHGHPNHQQSRLFNVNRGNTKTTDFYCFSSILLEDFLINGFLENHVCLGVTIEIGLIRVLTESNEFLMGFFQHPKSSLSVQDFLNIMSPFINSLLQANSENDLSSVKIGINNNRDSPAYSLSVSNVMDMFDLLERVLSPKDMTLCNSFEGAQRLSFLDSYKLDAIGPLQRLKSLASLALGRTGDVNGLDLVH